MRILANYGCKTNGESYSVTFETMGDVGKEKVELTVDELFRLAKEAIKRQVNGSASGPKKEIPQEPQLKNPDAPATKKQVNLIIKLAKEKGQFIENPSALTVAEASRTIEELMAA
jgi:predicted RNase H-like HicB family nuclease